MDNIQQFFTLYNGRRVFAGTLGKDKVFRKKVKIRDKLRLHMAFGLDKSYLDDVFAYGAEKIQLTVTDADQLYEIDADTFRKHAFLDDVGKYRDRFYCPLLYWNSRSLPPKGGRK